MLKQQSEITFIQQACINLSEGVAWPPPPPPRDAYLRTGLSSAVQEALCKNKIAAHMQAGPKASSPIGPQEEEG